MGKIPVIGFGNLPESRIEYEIEGNGDASYELDIKLKDGKEVKLEVDAASGKIVGDKETELYQIGKEWVDWLITPDDGK